MYEPEKMFKVIQNNQIISRVMYNMAIFFILKKEGKKYKYHIYLHVCYKHREKIWNTCVNTNYNSKVELREEYKYY